MTDPELEKLLEKKMAELSRMEVKRGMGSSPINLDRNSFDQAIGGDRPVIVDFWAEWCGPCRFMLPVFEKLASKYGEKMVFARLNVDESPEIASRYGVFSIPTFIVFVSGRPMESVVGAVGEKGLEKVLSNYVAK